MFRRDIVRNWAARWSECGRGSESTVAALLVVQFHPFSTSYTVRGVSLPRVLGNGAVALSQRSTRLHARHEQPLQQFISFSSFSSSSTCRCRCPRCPRCPCCVVAVSAVRGQTVLSAAVSTSGSRDPSIRRVGDEQRQRQRRRRTGAHHHRRRRGFLVDCSTVFVISGTLEPCPSSGVVTKRFDVSLSLSLSLPLSLSLCLSPFRYRDSSHVLPTPQAICRFIIASFLNVHRPTSGQRWARATAAAAVATASRCITRGTAVNIAPAAATTRRGRVGLRIIR